jgi:hypothetical protein
VPGPLGPPRFDLAYLGKIGEVASRPLGSYELLAQGVAS